MKENKSCSIKMYQGEQLQTTLIMVKIYIKHTSLGSCQNWLMQRKVREEMGGKKKTSINIKWVLHVAFVCKPCKSHCAVHLGPSQMNKSLPLDKLIKMSSCCWACSITELRLLPCVCTCVSSLPFFSLNSRPEVTLWVCLHLGDSCYDYHLSPKTFPGWILTRLT